jgi:hypothetical protein
MSQRGSPPHLLSVILTPFHFPVPVFLLSPSSGSYSRERRVVISPAGGWRLGPSRLRFLGLTLRQGTLMGKCRH